MKYITLITIALLSTSVYSASVKRVDSSGRYLYLRLNSGENLRLIYGGPVVLKTSGKDKKLKGYLIRKEGREATIELTPPVKNAVDKGGKITVNRAKAAFHNRPGSAGKRPPPWSLFCPLSLCMAGIKEARHDWLFGLRKDLEHREIQGQQTAFRQTGLRADISSAFTEPALPVVFVANYSYSHLKGPATITGEDGESVSREDRGGMGAVIPVLTGTIASFWLKHRSVAYYGDIYVKSRHVFQQTEIDIAATRTFAFGRLGISLQSPVNKKSQEGSEIVFYQRSSWLRLMYWRKGSQNMRFFASLILEPNSTLDGFNNSWRNAFQLQGAMRIPIVRKFSLELGLMRRSQRFFAPDSGIRGKKVAANRLTVELSRPFSGWGRAGLRLQVLAGDGRGTDHQGEFYQASSLREEIAVTASFSL